MKKIIRLLSFVLILTSSSCRKIIALPDQPILPGEANGWTLITALPAQKISVLKNIDNIIYAAASSGIVYHSADSGKTWNHYSKIKDNVQITALLFLKNKIFIGTLSDGVYMSPDNGNTWINTFPFSKLAPVTSFVIWNNHLYCWSAILNDIYAYDENTIDWAIFNNAGMPDSYNQTVEKVIMFNNTLLTIKGVNGNFYTYDQAAANWNEHFFFSKYVAGVRITDIFYENNVLYASYGPAILRSNNMGATWAYDTAELKTANDIISPTRVMYSGSNSYYTLLNVGSYETWIQQRSKTAPLGSTWATHQEHLSIGYSYDICQLGNKLFLATANGLYYKNNLE